MCPSNRTNSVPAATSHRRTVWSKLPESADLPSGAKSTASVPEECPANDLIFCPVETSQSVSAPSVWTLERARFPSAEKAIASTGSEFPEKVLSSLAVARSQSLILPPLPPTAKRPSPETAIDQTIPLRSAKDCDGCRVGRSQIVRVLS